MIICVNKRIRTSNLCINSALLYHWAILTFLVFWKDLHLLQRHWQHLLWLCINKWSVHLNILCYLSEYSLFWYQKQVNLLLLYEKNKRSYPKNAITFTIVIIKDFFVHETPKCSRWENRTLINRSKTYRPNR